LNTPSVSNLATQISVHELISDGTFTEIYNSLGDLTRLVLTQSQVVMFCKEHPDKLRDNGLPNFFLLKKELKEGVKANPEFFVAHVFVRDDGHLYASVYPFSDGNVWRVWYQCHFVFPL
jgi:hypothetical protein